MSLESKIPRDWKIFRMAQHTGLFGSIPPPKATDRLFFALFPSEETIPHIIKISQQLRAEHGLPGKYISNDRMRVCMT